MCPMYQYQCSSCKQVFDEFWGSFKEAEEHEPKYLTDVECPNCKSKEKIRLMSSPMVSFKGEGWTNKVIGPEGGSSTGRKDSTGALKEHAARIKDEVKNLTSKDLYGV